MAKLTRYEDKIRLLVNDSWGIYVPQRFAESFTASAWGIDENSEDWQTILNGPDSEWYWESWDSILGDAKHTDDAGVVWTLHQDGDLWAVAWDEMTEEEKENFGV